MKKGTVGDGLVYHAGFPNAGEDQHGRGLSLDQLVIKHRVSTFFWRLPTGVPELQWPANTILVVDRAQPPAVGRIVVVVVDEAFTLCRYTKRALFDLNGDVVKDSAALWGVVTYALQEVT